MTMSCPVCEGQGNIYNAKILDLGINDSLGDACSGNITELEKEDNFILLSDLYSEEETPTELKMTRNQFIKLLDDWEIICKSKPKEVIIKCENDQFIVETNN